MRKWPEITAELQIRCDDSREYQRFLGGRAKDARRGPLGTVQGHVCWLCQSDLEAMSSKQPAKVDRLSSVQGDKNKEHHTVEGDG